MVNAAALRRHTAGLPTKDCRAYARRRYRWASCSQVNPIPPRIWIQSLVLATAASTATAAATAAASESCWESPLFASTSCAQPAASQTATSACSTRHSISAHMCLMA
ncbi:Uncharacterised protein [Mycobacteroides abscessus subsp. abscessus]|nr:Uncharacterised protein [Mycobacteroides abscessus subsp. abscessus]